MSELDQYGFSVRVRNALKGCSTLAEVASRMKGEWMRVPNLGKKSIKEIEKVLAAHGLQFAHRIDRPSWR